MVREALEWLQKESHKKAEEFIGVTTTLLALLTAAATLAGHRAHTDEVKFQTLATDKWGFYQAKHIRSHIYGIEAEKALLSNNSVARDLAKKYLTNAIYEQCGEPSAPSCHIENCQASRKDDAKIETKDACNVPVLKDSPELLEPFFKDILFKDTTFRQRFLPASSLANASKIAGERKELVALTHPERVKTCKQSTRKAGKTGAIDILDEANCKDSDVEDTTNEALHYDIAEIVLEASIMFCGVALVIGTETYRKSAYFITLVAVTVALGGVGVALFALQHPVDHPYVYVATIAAAVLIALAFISWLFLYSQEPGRQTTLETSSPGSLGDSHL